MAENGPSPDSLRRIRGAESVSGDRLRPELVADLWKRLVVEVGNVVETPVDRGDLLRRQFQRHLLLPELIQHEIVGALRALATDVDVTRMPRAEWKERNEAAGIGVF